MIFEVLDSYDKRLKREKDFIGILIHHTSVNDSKPKDENLWDKLSNNITAYLTKKDNQLVSAHFIISHSGKVTRLVDPDYYEAFHAGESKYWHPVKRQVLDSWNRFAIGIEIVGDGNLFKYTDAQYLSLINLCKYLMQRYPDIHPLGIVGHENVAPYRKDDPGKFFDWLRFFKGLYER